MPQAYFILSLLTEYRKMEIQQETYSTTYASQGSYFSSSHYHQIEFLHGHDYHLSLTVNSTQLLDGEIIKSSKIKALIEEICVGYDHKIFITESGVGHEVEDLGDHVGLTVRGLSYEFPKRLCVFLPIVLGTCEEISRYLSLNIANRLRSELEMNPGIYAINVKISEVYKQQEASTILEIKEHKF
ncbi:unnamed protein product [Blepharisma stoltei]|uniref:6-pyruvoyltetrahydropterin synthase n=1 Tax=Blepharisma stoltei TaxID=1481888 RepID=A0AAU9KGA8_9CILI|nr:unnamed protein product [Blepharisma stoltei]